MTLSRSYSHSSNRAGMSFFRFIFTVLVFSVFAVLAWGVYANWNLDRDEDGEPDGFTMDVHKKEWWDTSKNRAEPWVEWSEEKLGEFKEDVWGEGGLLDDIESWMQEREKTRPAAGSEAAQPAAGDGAGTTSLVDGQQAASKPDVPAAAPKPEPKRSPATLRLEDKINTADELFTEAMRHYKNGAPAANGWNDQSIAELRKAKDCLVRARKILSDDAAVKQYGDMDDHDSRILKDAQELERHTFKLLHTVNKVGNS